MKVNNQHIDFMDSLQNRGIAALAYSKNAEQESLAVIVENRYPNKNIDFNLYAGGNRIK